MTDLALEREAIGLFEQLLDLPEAERDAWLAERTADRPDLLARIAAMRAADRGGAMRTGGAADEVDEESPPERIGAYRIAERIGRGGMGSVYRGERMTGDFAHVVAIKIIKPGLLSETLIERFRRERQLLAGLTHPNIAQLYDGGETGAGSPYFVMEHVDGLPLLQWVEERAPPRAARQRLFRDICGAVAFAHRSLVVHRDLTPSNVLVTRDGVVKLIDFGIARPAEEAGAKGDSSAASIGSLSLTPGYAAPERMTSSAVTTAADVYSLGKLLEKLLPPGPGDRELKAIVARATALDPQGRYPTADALGDDVAAWQAGFPVAAMAGGGAYRARRFVGRHRIGTAAAVLAALLLIGAFGLTLAAWSRAETARRAEAARFEELRSLAHYMLFDLNGRLSRVVGNAAARLTLANRAQAYLSALASSPGASDALKLEAARGLIALAEVQGVPAQPNLGQPEQARANLARANAMLRSLDLPIAVKGPDMVQGLAAFAMIEAHVDTEVEVAGRSLAQARRVLASVPVPARGVPWLIARRRLRHAELELTILGQDLNGMQRLAGLLESEIADWPAPMRHSREAGFDRAYAVYYRGLRDYLADDLGPSVSTFHRSEAMFVALDRATPNDPATLYALLWNSYVAYGAASGAPALAPDAVHFLDLALATSDRLLRIEPSDHALQSFAGSLRQSQATALSTDGRHAEAIAIQREVLALYTAALGRERKAGTVNRMLTAQITMGNIATAAGDRALACASYGSVKTLLAELRRRGQLPANTGRYAAAIDGNLALCARGGSLSDMTDIG